MKEALKSRKEIDIEAAPSESLPEIEKEEKVQADLGNKSNILASKKIEPNQIEQLSQGESQLEILQKSLPETQITPIIKYNLKKSLETIRYMVTQFTPFFNVIRDIYFKTIIFFTNTLDTVLVAFNIDEKTIEAVNTIIDKIKSTITDSIETAVNLFYSVNDAVSFFSNLTTKYTTLKNRSIIDLINDEEEFAEFIGEVNEKYKRIAYCLEFFKENILPVLIGIYNNPIFRNI